MTEAFSFCSGPRDAAIAIVGEAWGEQDKMAGRPFFGASGQELTRMLTTERVRVGATVCGLAGTDAATELDRRQTAARADQQAGGRQPAAIADHRRPIRAAVGQTRQVQPLAARFDDA